MQDTDTNIWNATSPKQFAQVLAAIGDSETMQSFLRDVMTENEIIEISARFQAAGMLQSGKKYTEIIDKTKLSSRTIARISDWIQNGKGGYKIALAITAQEHLPPARAE